MPPSHTATPRNWTLDPAGDWHYRWISLMALPILYNWVVLILRCQAVGLGWGCGVSWPRPSDAS